MTKTIKELLDEKFDSYHKRRMENKDCPCIEGCSQCEYRNGKIDEIISQVEALVRRETLKDILEYVKTAESPIYAARSTQMLREYASDNTITL